MPSSSPLSCHAIGTRWFLNALEPDKVLALIFPLAKDLGSRHGNRSHVSFRYPFCEVAGKRVYTCDRLITFLRRKPAHTCRVPGYVFGSAWAKV